MLRFGEPKVTKEKFYAAKQSMKICDINAANIGILVLAKTLIGYLGKAMRPLVLIMPKMSGHAKIFKVKVGEKDKNNKLMSFRIVDEKLLEKYKAII